MRTQTNKGDRNVFTLLKTESEILVQTLEMTGEAPNLCSSDYLSAAFDEEGKKE